MLTRTTVPQLRSTLLEALSRGGPHLVLDLAAVGRIDDFGLDALQRTAGRARLEGGDLHVAAPTPPVAARLRRSGVAWRLSVHHSLAAAVTAVAARTPFTALLRRGWFRGDTSGLGQVSSLRVS